MSSLFNHLKYSALSNLLKQSRLNRFKREWRHKNPNNKTIPERLFPIDAVRVGKNSYGRLNVISFSDDSFLVIGNYVSIADNVSFVIDGEHFTNTLSTFPFKVEILKQETEALSKGNITVDNDVWIGYGATILSGVHIGQGAVIAAGAVVSKDVPPYAIVGGVPAKIIRYRFSPEVIEFLLTLDYSALDETKVREHVDELYREMDKLELENIKQLFSWFPKRMDDCL